jgi:hypothetical protein
MISIVNNIDPTIHGNPLVPILLLFPDSIEAFFTVGALSTSLWVSMHKNAQSKQQIREVLEGKIAIVAAGMRWLFFVILVA